MPRKKHLVTATATATPTATASATATATPTATPVPQVALPTFDPGLGMQAGCDPVKVAITTTTAGANIRYTLDYRNRVELPTMGVFLQPDPIGFKGDAANVYRFCNNNALNRIDPTGGD